MKISKRGGYAKLEFESCQDIMRYLDKHTFPESTSHKFQSNSFCDYSWDESMEFLRAGWTEGVAHVDSISKELKSTMNDGGQTYNIEYDVTGDYIDMGQYVTGEPECFGNVTCEPMPMECLDILIDTCFSSSVNQDAIYNRGAAITTIIDELQKSYFVNVTIAAKVGANSKMTSGLEIVFNIDMKNEYSRDLVAFYTANSAFFRRICFAIMEIYFNKETLGGYGNVKPLPKKDGQILFPAGSSEVNSKYLGKETTVKEIERVLSQYQMGGA